METASFDGFLKTLFYIIMFYYVFKFVAKLLLPVVVKKVVEKASQNFQNQYQNNGANSQYSVNDEVILDTANAKQSKEKKKVGDYVDYEEIE